FGFLESSSYRLVRFDALEHNRRVAAALWKLRAERQAVVSRTLARAVESAGERLADYLIAAREAAVHRPEPQTARPGEFSPAFRRRLEESAGARKLAPDRLGRWVLALQGAAEDAAHPLHLWARGTAGPDVTDAKQTASAALPGPDVVIDYARCEPADWLPDEFSFGPSPVRAGDARVGGTVG